MCQWRYDPMVALFSHQHGVVNLISHHFNQTGGSSAVAVKLWVILDEFQTGPLCPLVDEAVVDKCTLWYKRTGIVRGKILAFRLFCSV